MAWPSVSGFNCKIVDSFKFDFPNLWHDRLKIDWLVTAVLDTANRTKTEPQKTERRNDHYLTLLYQFRAPQ